MQPTIPEFPRENPECPADRYERVSMAHRRRFVFIVHEEKHIGVQRRLLVLTQHSVEPKVLYVCIASDVNFVRYRDLYTGNCFRD